MFKTKQEIIVIQAEATDPITTGVVFWSHDKGTAKMLFQLQKDYVNQMLAVGTIVPICLDFVGGRHIYHAVIEDAVNGIVSIVLEDNILGYVGRVTGSIYIELPDSRSLDTAGRFTFDIRRSPIDENTPELEDYFWQGFEQITEEFRKSLALVKSECEEALNDLTTKITDLVNQTADIQLTQSTILQQIESNQLLTKTEADNKYVDFNHFSENAVTNKGQKDINSDWDTVLDQGYYIVGGDQGANRPESEAWGILEVIVRNEDELYQKFSSIDEPCSIYERTLGYTGVFGPWHKLAFEENTVTIAGNQTIGGTKNFQNTPLINDIPAGIANEACWCEDFAVNNLAAGIVNPDLQRFSTSNEDVFSSSGKVITIKKSGVYLIALGVNYTGLTSWLAFGISRVDGTSLVNRNLLGSATSGSNSFTYVRSFEGNDQIRIEFNSGAAGTTMQKINLAIVKIA